MTQPDDEVDSAMVGSQPISADETDTTGQLAGEQSGSASVHVGKEKAEGEPPPTKPYRGTPLWRRLIALLGLATFSVLGGIAIALTIAALVVTAAIVLQLVIS